MSWWILGLAVPATVLTESRANALSLGILLVGWVVLLPTSQNLGKKITIVAGLGLVVFLSAGIWAERIATGEDGTFRAHFTEVALASISLMPWSGTGPNSYVEVAGRLDALTASGWPVHNSFLLAAAELGIAGAVALFLPMIALALRSAIRVLALRPSPSDKAAIVMTIAILPIALTGWGMMSDTLPLWYFAAGYLWGAPVAALPKDQGGLSLGASKRLHQPVE
ncbi:O-antigen ligase family protein [Microbacterium testaceum]|uniref:O-antigen ligase family protein n=1 Tax=Microbacterium testaceum TaxID=2033 RepID=UPI0010571DD1|nr:hypothetical protein [Microbacterium testaceum]